jgi:hypothetical protein
MRDCEQNRGDFDVSALDCKESGETYYKHCKKAEQQMFEMASTRQKKNF